MAGVQVILSHARVLARALIDRFEAAGHRAALAGEARIGHELVDSLSLVAAAAPAEVALLLEEEADLVRVGPASLAGALRLDHGELPLRVRCASPKGFVEALLRETGTDDHVEALEQRAHRTAGKTLGELAHGAHDEHEVYAALGLPFLPPELRDDEPLDDAAGHALIERVEGVFHVHTTWSDGTASIDEMALAARRAGFAYVGISDHSRAASYARGLDEARLAAQREAVARARAQVPGIEILHGLEVDVLDDGSLDLPDAALAQLDFVVASIHDGLHLGREAQTRRAVRALEHPLVTILGHPTGRLLLGRRPIAIDLDEVARASARSGATLEINTSAMRLDLDAEHTRRARALGATFCIDPDAHEPSAFSGVELGLVVARRARLSPDRVRNALEVGDLVRWLHGRRESARSRLDLPR
jgi:DNA polymerase (family 10)